VAVKLVKVVNEAEEDLWENEINVTSYGRDDFEVQDGQDGPPYESEAHGRFA
jgi:hypothetical protein